jgi:hypothetical protein
MAPAATFITFHGDACVSFRRSSPRKPRSHDASRTCRLRRNQWPLPGQREMI